MSDNTHLKGKRISYIEVEYGDFEELVMKTYNLDEWSFPADMECNNGYSKDFSIDKDEILSNHDKDRLKKFIDDDGKGDYMAGVLLVDMYNKGLISHGNYLIQVWW